MFFYTLVAKLGVFNREKPLKWCFFRFVSF